MRSQAVLLLLSLVSVTAGRASGEEALIAHYPFDEGSGSVVRDASGHGLHGTVHGAQYAKLQQGFALEFDGKDDYVEIPDAELLRLDSALTVECWVNTPIPSEQAVLAKNGCGTLRQNYRLGLEPKGVRLTLVACPENEETVRGTGIEPNSWYHLAGSYDGDKLRVYVNGARTGEHGSGPFAVGTLGKIGVHFSLAGSFRNSFA